MALDLGKCMVLFGFGIARTVSLFTNVARCVFCTLVSQPLFRSPVLPRICKRAALGTGIFTSCAAPRVAAPRHGRATRGRLRHTGARFDPSDDGCLRAPAGTITDACGRSDAPGSGIHELPDFDPLATKLATSPATDDADNTLNWDLVGRPGLDPAPWD